METDRRIAVLIDADNVSVITSYSIHYTKLYDFPWMGFSVTFLGFISGYCQLVG